MEKIIWTAYKRFCCIAASCPDSCCQGWEVDVDEDSARYYRSMQGPLGDRLRQVLKTENGETAMRLENGRCPMWRQDGLCRIQAEKGHDALCQVCREYPRLIMDYGDFAEWGLEMSCPEAARLLFEDLSADISGEPGGGNAEYEPEIMDILRQSRSQLLSFWESGELSVPKALTATLLYAHRVQAAIDSGETEVHAFCAEETNAGTGNITLLLDFFRDLEILTEAWKARLTKAEPGTWDPRLRQLAKYLVRRYWLQSVWDHDLVCRAKLVVAACILVNYLGGDTVHTAQLFAKEIENDPDNMDAVFDAAYTQPAFTDANLLGLLK